MLLDTWLIFRRESLLRLRAPLAVAIDTAYPLLYVFLFGPLMTQFVKHTPGFPPGSMWTIFTPAMMMQAAVNAGCFVGMGLLVDYRAGVVERFRVTPSSVAAQLMGRVFAVTLKVVLVAGVIVAFCVAVFGLRPSPVHVLVSFGVVALFAVTVASCSYAVALRLKNEHSVAALINAVLLPLLLLSGTLVPITKVLAPGWLYLLSRLNPVSYIMDAARASFRGDLGLTSFGPGLAVLLTLTTLSVWWGVRTFNREDV
ncbi:MAG TPA: ABC transporter permease [Pseudonocardiaceae bacterium]|jgi:ABC-2 type transport system permease protein|nr:ABC transporter permease [Pseudonocardiaceae bacterium]